jgi:hypothetical protein
MSEDDMDTDSGTREDTNNEPKRFKSKSPEPSTQAYGPIETALNNVDHTLSNIRTYMSDMIGSTKIGKKWAFGMEEFLTEILVQTKKVDSKRSKLLVKTEICPRNSGKPNNKMTNS